MFWRSQQQQQQQSNQGGNGGGVGGGDHTHAHSQTHGGGGGEDNGDYDQYVFEEDPHGEEMKVSGVRFTVNTSSGAGDGYDDYHHEGEEEEDDEGGGGRGSRNSGGSIRGGDGTTRPQGSPRLSGLFNRYGHQEGSQLLLGGSRKSLHKMNKSSRSITGDHMSSSSLASTGSHSNPTARTTPKTSPKGSHPSLGRAHTLRARSPQTTFLLRDSLRSDSQHHLDQLHSGMGMGSGSYISAHDKDKMRRSGSMPTRVGIPSHAAHAAAHAATSVAAESTRRSGSKGSKLHLQDGGGEGGDSMWRSVSLGGAKGVMKRDGSKVILSMHDGKDHHRHLHREEEDEYEEGEEEDDDSTTDAFSMLVSFGYYLMMPGLRWGCVDVCVCMYMSDYRWVCECVCVVNIH